MRLRPFACLSLVLAAGCGSTPSLEQPVDPVSEYNTTERDRELRDAGTGPLAAAEKVWIHSTYEIDDLADRISKRPLALATQLENAENPDTRRRALMGLADREWGQKPPYTTRYAQIAADPSNDYLLRAAAIRALNRAREPGHGKLFIAGLSDSQQVVRLESAKALNRLPDPEAAGPLLDLARRPDEDRDVRIAALQALQHYKRLEVARSLVAMLNERDFSLAWQARRSLARIAGRDLGYNEAAWLSFLAGPEKPADLL